MQPQTRQQMIQKIHIGKNELGMDRNTYVQFLLETVDKHSCSVMTDAELMQVLQAMQAKGFKVKSNKHGKRPTASADDEQRNKLLAKIEALLAEGGYHWNYAHGTAKRAFGKARVQWLNNLQLHKLVKMLAVNARRQGKPT